MSVISYLSPTNCAEDNLRIVAEDKVFVTANLKEPLRQQALSSMGLVFVKAAIVATLALGILLKDSVSYTLGACVVIAAIIPIAFWINMRNVHRSIQFEVDKEKEKLEEIYQRMIHTVQARYLLLHRYLFQFVDHSQNARDKIENERQIKASLSTRMNQLVATKLGDWDLWKDDFSEEGIDSRQYRRYAKIVQLFGKANANPKANVARVIRNIEQIAASKLSPSISTKNWKKLQNLCKAYVESIDKSLVLKRDGKWEYRDHAGINRCLLEDRPL